VESPRIENCPVIEHFKANKRKLFTFSEIFSIRESLTRVLDKRVLIQNSLYTKLTTKSYVHKEKIVQAVWIDETPNKEPLKSTTGRVWSINAELAGCDTLNNNALVKVANQTAADFIAQDFKR